MSKILIDRSVVEQALEALNASMPHNNNMEEDWPSHIAARRALRAALEQPQVEQEPDAFREWWRMRPSLTRLQAWLIWKDEHKQPPRQPLTREEIAFIAAACGGLASDFVVSVARAIEAAHGVKGRK